MEIKFSRNEFKDDVINLWKYCFNDGDEYIDFYFRNKYCGDKVLVATRDINKPSQISSSNCKDRNNIDSVFNDRVKECSCLNKNMEDISYPKEKAIASISLNEHCLNIGYKNIICPYVVGVSTLPEGRGNGVMNELMLSSIYHMYNSGNMMSILMPIDFRLYSKYGFVNCYDMMNTSLDIFDLRKFRIKGWFEEGSVDSIDDILYIYQRAMTRYNGYSVRDRKYFEEFLEEIKIENSYIYVNYIDGMPAGYVVYTIQNDELSVREVYYLNIESYKSMLKFIFNHNTQAKRVNLITPIDDRLIDILDNPKTSRFEIRPFMMARIINIKKFIEVLDISCDDFKDIYIDIKDNIITENNGVHRLYSINNKLCIDKVSVDKVNTELSINVIEDIEKLENTQYNTDVIDISELTQIILGYRSVDDIDRLREMPFTNITDLRSAFRHLKSTNHINEYV